jgi:ribosomal protein S18 acetylase RimI-like enzyme
MAHRATGFPSLAGDSERILQAMEIRAFRPEDAPSLAGLASDCARGEADFVLNPFWSSEAELYAEFERFGIAPEEHLQVADAGGEIAGLVGFLRQPGAKDAGMFCPIVQRSERGRGLGGELLRAAQEQGRSKLGIELVTAGNGTRNRGGYSLLTSHGFRPARQAFLMKCDQPAAAGAPPLEGGVFEEARKDDADVILSIYDECPFPERSAETMVSILGDGRHRHSVVRHEGEVIGFCELETHWPTRPWVAFVGVRKQLRDRGIGTALVSWSLGQVFAAGAQAGLLMLSPANRTALRAYEKVGFRRFRLIDVLEKAL